ALSSMASMSFFTSAGMEPKRPARNVRRCFCVAFDTISSINGDSIMTRLLPMMASKRWRLLRQNSLHKLIRPCRARAIIAGAHAVARRAEEARGRGDDADLDHACLSRLEGAGVDGGFGQ